jgi:hypothetical protein
MSFDINYKSRGRPVAVTQAVVEVEKYKIYQQLAGIGMLLMLLLLSYFQYINGI